jgi:hypothetical protein
MSQNGGVPVKIPSNAEIDKELKEFEAKKASGGIVIPIQSSAEIDQALNAFEAQSGGAQEVRSGAEKVAVHSGNSKMAALVIKYSGGLIKSENAAQYVLLGIVVLCISISLYLFFGGGTPHPKGSNIVLPATMTPPVNNQ